MTGETLKVWVVDDDQSVRWVLEKALRQEKMDTRSFERAEHLLEAMDLESPDVLVTDVRMPGMSGIALLEEVNRRWPELPVIVITMSTTVGWMILETAGLSFLGLGSQPPQADLLPIRHRTPTLGFFQRGVPV